MNEIFIRILQDLEPMDAMGQTWNFKAGEIKDHVYVEEDGCAVINYG